MLRCNSHTLQFTYLKYTILLFLVPSQDCVTIQSTRSPSFANCPTSPAPVLAMPPSTQCSEVLHPALHASEPLPVLVPHLEFPSIFYAREPVKTFSHPAHKTRRKGVRDTRHVCHGHFEIPSPTTEIPCSHYMLMTRVSCHPNTQYSQAFVLLSVPNETLSRAC